ncbi:T9SS type A sorting domain-containing protein [Salibacteraceae bacterium]|nr:T9SS type A sorting domain-containing protein [Salibacteraceae bacterium]MDB4104696.1 T9SS type A sorting domain-containing protein [Salibacteraceae bacterium]MDC1304248.1 T9SS type A sorting domain-containing protein [Salibacteraceae bacterium]
MKKILLATISLAYIGLGHAQTYMSEDFSSGIPATWTQSTLANDGGWIAGTAASLSSGSFPYSDHGDFIGSNDDGCNCDKSADSLMTDYIDLTSTGATVVSLNIDMYYVEGTYQGVTESFDVYAQSQSTGAWTLIYDAPLALILEWQDGLTFDLSSYIGDQVRLLFLYGDGGGWLFGVGVDNVRVFTPAADDAFNQAITNSPFHEVNTANSIAGTIKNVGSEAITSFDVSYTTDGGAAVSGSITGLNVAPGASYAFTHPTPWTPTTVQTFEVQTEVTMVNGNVDGDPSNNITSMDIIVHPPAVARTPVLEAFTSSTCGPCTPGNINVGNVLSAFPDEYSKVNYQMSWPGAGDPYFTNEGGDRRTYYDVNSVPNIFTDGANGINSNSYTANDFTSAKAVPAFISMEAEATVNKDVVYAVVNGQLEMESSKWVLNSSSWYTPIIDLPGNLVAHHAINEKQTFLNVESNGETEFEHVMKKMMPDASGEFLNAVTANDTVMLTNSHDFVGEYRLSNDAGDPIIHSSEHSVEEFSDLEIVFWIQNPTTGEVWQSYHQDVELTEETSNLTVVVEDGDSIYVIGTDSFEMTGTDGSLVPLSVEGTSKASFRVYPNPAKDMVYISGVEGFANVTVFDVQGRTVKQVSTDANTLRVSDLNAGMYMIRIENNGVASNTRISVTK